MLTKVIVTGASGFLGTALVECLREKDIEVYAIVRTKSRHYGRLDQKDLGLHVIRCEMSDYGSLGNIIQNAFPDIDSIDAIFHLAWADIPGIQGQIINIQSMYNVLESAREMNISRFIGVGSQAEYGIVLKEEMMVESYPVNPNTMYGASKVAICYLSKSVAEHYGIEWAWGRVFSVIGKREPDIRMMWSLYKTLKSGEVAHLSSCSQNWDYLDVYDAAEALICLAEKGRDGEVYNIANGNFRPLKEFTEELKRTFAPSGIINYGDDISPYRTLQPSVQKIFEDTGWRAKRSFADSIMSYQEHDAE